MQGDFSLNPLAYRAGVSRVLVQQGRVQLDSDANEQVEALLRTSRGLALDMIGAHGGIDGAFELVDITPGKPDLRIRWGVYYVDGIRCVNFPADFDVYAAAALGQPVDAGLAYKAQREYFPPADGDWVKGAGGPVLFYLDVFERHVSATEDESLREVALLGPDTASRAVIVWQVRTMPAKALDDRLAKLTTPVKLPATWDLPYLALNLVLRSSVRMRARAIVTESTDACTVSPDARYRGPDNRLFRVEIHDQGGGVAKPTIKWSPDNGSTAYPVRGKIEGRTVPLDSLGRDDRTTIRVNDWVEVVDDRVSLMGKANLLLQVVEVRPHEMSVTLSDEPADNAGGDENLHPVLRRWSTAPIEIREGKNDRDGWFALADGVEVQFSHVDAADGAPDATYRTGDYWLIPARTATGDVIWPHDKGHPLAVAPHGVGHHYAPLATVDPKTGTVVKDYRRTFEPMAKPVP